jgi:hypothetical protein
VVPPAWIRKNQRTLHITQRRDISFVIIYWIWNPDKDVILTSGDVDIVEDFGVILALKDRIHRPRTFPGDHGVHVHKLPKESARRNPINEDHISGTKEN